MPYAITDSDRSLAEEFRRLPIGKHSPALNRLLTSLRHNQSGRQLVLLTTVPFREWVVAILPADRAAEIEIEAATVFHSREEAEWAVFCRRWQDRTGSAIG